jgi:GNAT superfamily N-acetyltransferase
MISIREACPSDRAGVNAVLTSCGLDPFRCYRDHYYRLVAVDESGTVVGFFDGSFDVPVPERAAQRAHAGPQAWGSWTAVAPDIRGKGVGTALLETFLQTAVREGCTYFAAMVSHHDEPSQRISFFRSCGLFDLVPNTPGDIVGAPIQDALHTISARTASQD